MLPTPGFPRAFACAAIGAGLLLCVGCKTQPKGHLSDSDVPPPPATMDQGYDQADTIEPQPMHRGSADNQPGQMTLDQSTTSSNSGGASAPAPGSSSMSSTYVVKKGDTLWSIAQAHYGDGQRWKDIVAANPSLNPKKMPVGKSIVLP